MSYLLLVRLAIAILLLVAGTAAAQPLTYQLAGDVAIGTKPMLKLTAVQKVTDVRIELERDDGKKFVIAQKALAKGQSVSLTFGDGAAGKASYKGTISAKVGTEPWKEQLTFDTFIRTPIKVTYDVDHLDLDKRVLQVKLSRTADTADLVVFGEDGKELGKGSAKLTGQTPNTWVSITWTQPADARVLKMKLRVASADGTATSVELIPWSVEIEHEEVNFATDSSVITDTETKKLDASVAKITEAVKRSEKFVKMTLYVAGHTDTVGAGGKNRTLSIARARAIAAYFRSHGIAIPIAYAGFGEDVLEVKTPDNTDSAANRRADYVLGPTGGSPPFKGPYLRVRVDWKQLR